MKQELVQQITRQDTVGIAVQIRTWVVDAFPFVLVDENGDVFAILFEVFDLGDVARQKDPDGRSSRTAHLQTVLRIFANVVHVPHRSLAGPPAPAK